MLNVGVVAQPQPKIFWVKVAPFFEFLKFFWNFLLYLALFDVFGPWYITPQQLFIPTPTKCYQPRHSKKKNFQFCRQRACEKAKLKIFLFWMSCAGIRKDLWLGFIISYLSYLSYPYLNWGGLIGMMTFFIFSPQFWGIFCPKLFFFHIFWLILTFWGVQGPN